jgi:hypothetical protein
VLFFCLLSLLESRIKPVVDLERGEKEEGVREQRKGGRNNSSSFLLLSSFLLSSLFFFRKPRSCLEAFSFKKKRKTSFSLLIFNWNPTKDINRGVSSSVKRKGKEERRRKREEKIWEESLKNLYLSFSSLVASEQRGMVSLTGSTVPKEGPLPYLGSVELVNINSVHHSLEKEKEREREREREEERGERTTDDKRQRQQLRNSLFKKGLG